MTQETWTHGERMTQSAYALGYCCATAYAGGDCCHSMALHPDPEPADLDPVDLDPVDLDPVDGRPVETVTPRDKSRQG